MNLGPSSAHRRPLAYIVALALIAAVLSSMGMSRIGSTAAAAATADPIVGDWKVTYGAPAVVTMTLSGGVYTVTAKSPVRVTGSSCDLPPGTVIATFSSTGGNTYSGQHGLWYTSDCSFGLWDPMSLTLSSDGNTLTGVLSGGYGTVVFTKVPATVAPLTVGFGDSVAAGYGLSSAAQWPPTDLVDRFKNGASCVVTPQSYPCVLATNIGDDPIGSANYAIQNATSNDVLNTEIPRATSDMSTDARAAVNTVTLTVGANDMNFAQCLQQEFQALLDSCLVNHFGAINHLQLSGMVKRGLQNLTANLPLIISELSTDFPHAHIYVTTYYQPFPGAVSPGDTACSVYTLPALAAFSNATQGVPAGAVIVAALQYFKVLPDTAKLFQARFARVSSFLLGKLNLAIRNGTAAASSPVTTVALDQAFNGHDICSDVPWVFTIRSTATLANVTIPNNTVVCPYPYSSFEFDQTYSFYSLGSVHINSNCLPHPTSDGQRNIALKIQTTPPA